MPVPRERARSVFRPKARGGSRPHIPIGSPYARRISIEESLTGLLALSAHVAWRALVDRWLRRSCYAGRMRPRLSCNYRGEREPWRHEAEVACLNSGTVKEGAGLVRISPIEGPGMCGADFPLKVAALGEGPALGYVEEPVRPPGVDSGREAAPPRSRAGRSRSSPIRRRAAELRRRRSPARRCRSKRPAWRSSSIAAASSSSARRRPICRRRRAGSAASRPASAVRRIRRAAAERRR